MPRKSSRVKPWFEPFYARVHEGIQQCGFVSADNFEQLIQAEPPDGLTPMNPPELKSYRGFRLRRYLGKTRDGVLQYVALCASKTNKGLNTALRTCVTVQPVTRLLAMLQGSPNYDALIEFRGYNPHLNLGNDSILTKVENQITAADELLASLKGPGLRWLEENSNLEEILNCRSPNYAYDPLAIACNLYRGQYDIAAEKVLRLESDIDKRTDIILMHRPELTREQAEQMELSVASRQLPNASYRNRAMIAKIKQACADKSLDCILDGRTLEGVAE